MPNYAYLLGGMGAAALSDAYYPRGERGGGPIVTNAVLVLWVVLPGPAVDRNIQTALLGFESHPLCATLRTNRRQCLARGRRLLAGPGA
jgi:hypothetical protein